VAGSCSAPAPGSENALSARPGQPNLNSSNQQSARCGHSPCRRPDKFRFRKRWGEIGFAGGGINKVSGSGWKKEGLLRGKVHMKNQPVPNVSYEDVKRIALREFGERLLPKALTILNEYGQQHWNKPSARVQLAILKLSNGDMDKLIETTQTAIADYRDVLSAAEYPRYAREIDFKKASEEVKSAVIEDDWNRYREWLEKT